MKKNILVIGFGDIAKRLTNKLNKDVLKLEVITNQQLIKQDLGEIPFGYLGPDLQDSYLQNAVSWNKKFLRFADYSAAKLDSFVCGANKTFLTNFLILLILLFSQQEITSLI